MGSDWVVLQISDAVENPGYGEIRVALTSIFGDRVDFFIPMHYEKVGTYTSTSTLMDGYVFVKDGPVVRDALGSVRDNRLFSGVLMSGKKIRTIPSSEIVGLRRKLRNSLRKKMPMGTPVRVCAGPLKDLVGVTAGTTDGGLTVVVKIVRYSRDILAPVPATLIERVESADA